MALPQKKSWRRPKDGLMLTSWLKVLLHPFSFSHAIAGVCACSLIVVVTFCSNLLLSSCLGTITFCDDLLLSMLR